MDDKYIVIIIMKPTNMKVPPLSQLYQQRQDYEAHKKKLQKIMSERKHNLLEGSKDFLRRINNNFQRRHNIKSLELAHQNSKIVKKIQSMKANINFKQSNSRYNQSRASRIVSSKARNIEQQKQNYRIKSKVNSMSSSLNSRNMIKDYRRSMQIKNRITHFKAEPNNKVILKVGRYLQNGDVQSKSATSLTNKKLMSNALLPKVKESQTFNKDVIDNKICKNAASYYKKDDILKNKVGIHNKLFKIARERRSHALTIFQKQYYLNKGNNSVIQQQKDSIFPTELSKRHK